MSMVFDIPLQKEDIYPESLLADLQTGDHVQLEDGEYKVGDYIYCIENQKIQTIFSALTDENQLSLEIH